MQDEINNPNQINIELSEDMADGTYSNLAIITHQCRIRNRLCSFDARVPKAKVKSRIILTPHRQALVASAER